MSCGASELTLYAIGHTPCSVRGISHRNKASFHYNTYSWNNLHRWKVHIQKATRESATMPYDRISRCAQAERQRTESVFKYAYILGDYMEKCVYLFNCASCEQQVVHSFWYFYRIMHLVRTAQPDAAFCRDEQSVFALPVCFLRIT